MLVFPILALIYNHLLPRLPVVAFVLALATVAAWIFMQAHDGWFDQLCIVLVALLCWALLRVPLGDEPQLLAWLWLLVAVAVYAVVRLALRYAFCTVAQLLDAFALAVGVACAEVVLRFLLHAAGLDQFWLSHPIYGARPLSRAGDWMTVSGLILLALPHMLHRAIHRYAWAHLWLVLALLALLLGGSRAGLLACWLVGGGLLLVPAFRVWAPLLRYSVAVYALLTITLLGLVAPLTLADRGVGMAAMVADSGRVAMWRDALATLDRYPLGLGLGGYEYRSALPFAPWEYVTTHPHNQILSVAVWLGWPGLALTFILAGLLLALVWPHLRLSLGWYVAIAAAWLVYFSLGTALWSVLASGAGALAIAVHSLGVSFLQAQKGVDYESRSGDGSPVAG
jgi:hypothetical protein